MKKYTKEIKETMQELFDRYDKILSGDIKEIDILKNKSEAEFNIYSVSNFRGGIGKTTLSFNLAYSMAKKYNTLFVDMCPQQNFTSLLLKSNKPYENNTIYDALMEKMMGMAWQMKDDQISLKLQDYNKEFIDGCKECYFIPGSSRLFLFPSQFYSRMNEYLGMTSSVNGDKPVAILLKMLKSIIREQMRKTNSEKTLIDTSPFFAGGTHLAWAASDALIIPVRVDEQSIYSLELTLEMLKDKSSDFNIWRERAGIKDKPTVQAVIMTHCGWNRQADHQIDSASRMYIERAVDIALKYKEVFTTDNIPDHFALLSDFHGAGRISGSEAIPIEKLTAGRRHHIEGRRLEVNTSVNRYKKELEYAYSLIHC